MDAPTFCLTERTCGVQTVLDFHFPTNCFCTHLQISFFQVDEAPKDVQETSVVPMKCPWTFHSRTEQSTDEVSSNWSPSIIFKLGKKKLNFLKILQTKSLWNMVYTGAV